MSFIGSIILILSSSFVSPVRAYDGSIMKVAGEYFYRVESLTPQSTDCRSSFASDLKWAIVSVATARECSKVCIRNYTWCLAFKILDAYVNKVCVVAEIGEDTYHNCYPYYRVPVCRIRGYSWGANDPPTASANANISVLKGQKKIIAANGINVVILNTTTCDISDVYTFNTYSDPYAASSFRSFIEGLQEGTVLIGTVYHDASSQLSSIYAYLNSLNVFVGDVTYGGKFAFAIIKGSSKRTVLKKSLDHTPLMFGIDVYGKN